jgi:hypothetical protein
VGEVRTSRWCSEKEMRLCAKREEKDRATTPTSGMLTLERDGR